MVSADSGRGWQTCASHAAALASACLGPGAFRSTPASPGVRGRDEEQRRAAETRSEHMPRKGAAPGRQRGRFMSAFARRARREKRDERCAHEASVFKQSRCVCVQPGMRRTPRPTCRPPICRRRSAQLLMSATASRIFRPCPPLFGRQLQCQGNANQMRPSS